MDGNEARIERRAGSREVSGPRLASARAGKRGWRGGAVAFCASVFLTFAIDSTFAQTSAEIRHLYDDLNRLIAVIDASGNAVAYDYDAVGNVIAIRRVDAAQLPGPVGITLVSPNAGLPGTPVSVFGKGFGSTPGQNTVSFNGTPAVVTSAAANAIGTTVPEGAVSGPISVTTPLGSATSPTPFQVLGAIALSPPSAVVLAGNTHQFGATESGNPTATMTWSVNGAAGGNATVGTVSPSGLYAAPAAVPSPAVVTVTAADSMAPTLHASAQVLIVGTPLGVAVAAAGVSVQMTASPQPFSVVADARRVSVQIAPVNLPASATVVARAVVVAVESNGACTRGHAWTLPCCAPSAP